MSVRLFQTGRGLLIGKEKRTARIFLDRSLHGNPSDELKCELTLRHPLVAVGAPAGAYMPKVAEILHTRLTLTPYAEVANAIGAIVGCVIHRRKILITPLEGGGRISDAWAGGYPRFLRP